MIFFTTLAGAAQGLMLGLVALDAAVALGLLMLDAFLHGGGSAT